MTIVQFTDYKVDAQIAQLFRDSPPFGQYCINPVTGGGYVGGIDPIEREKRIARQALLAREWFAATGPRDAPPLPLSDPEIEDLKYKHDGFNHILSCFGYSLRSLDWDFSRHPGFEDFARGVLASETAPDFVLEDEALRRLYPPRPLEGLSQFFVWKPVRGSQTRRRVG